MEGDDFTLIWVTWNYFRVSLCSAENISDPLSTHPHNFDAIRSRLMFQQGTESMEKKNMPYLGLTESLSSGVSVPSQWGSLQDTPHLIQALSIRWQQTSKLESFLVWPEGQAQRQA